MIKTPEEIIDYWNQKTPTPHLDEQLPTIIRFDGYHVTRDNKYDLFIGGFTAKLHQSVVRVFSQYNNIEVFSVLDESSVIMHNTKDIAERFESPNMVYIASYFTQLVSRNMSNFHNGIILGTNIYQTDATAQYLNDRKELERYTACVYYHKRILKDNLYTILDYKELENRTEMVVKPDFFDGLYYSNCY